ncbi:radical SAM protein [Engelhardtia mirabilis]|uniref:Antilisterial bacteriocin subtilosin biosynthesis protein AlbA n=1 Tax=Engelhardtia mirabilis TaxID=2528011 RepID=A0A518BPQ5_9BACT|nr:Antilisterial bacteriocin subtilosin biosynthesis protein AlbA [Planctomycetes bacterium Pla133]QDV03284.1 Antilisterial bacteriocin subtilosin biosynthesis protein AlbA [Planctomycetes bacterium Pla86]
MNALRYLPFVARGLRRDGPPLHLTLFVTGACNLRCRHCFHWKEVAEGIQGPSLEKIQRLADSAATMGPLLWVSFGGGEPFLRRDLPDLADAFGRHGLRHLAIPTNGLIKHMDGSIDAILERCPQTYLSVSVSFDGPPAVHDAIRQIDGGHAKSMAAVKRLKERAADEPNLGVGVIVTVTAENQDSLAGHLEELVDELHPDNVTINLARQTALDESLLVVDLARYREVVETKRRLMDAGKLPYFDFPLAKVAVARDRLMYDHVEQVAAGGAKRHLPCTAGALSAVIFEGGEVHPCEVLGKPMGQLDDFDWDLAALWRAHEAKELRREIIDTRCECTWECAQADNVLFNARAWPKLLAQMTVGRAERR